MPIHKGQNRKNVAKFKKDPAKIPTKESPRKAIEIGITGAEPKRRITALATVGKKKKPK